MVIFINDIPVTIFKVDEQPDPGRINHTIDAAIDTITQARLINHVLINNTTVDHFDSILQLLDSKVPTNLLSLFLVVNDYDAIKTLLKRKFKIVKAAGGLIRKKERFLMIYRMKKWDLPKGKKEKGERAKETAVREVEEECNVAVKPGKKICTTWHTYTMNKRAMLKQTKWYSMECVDDTKMRPEETEDIEEIRWMTQKEVYHALEHSYKSISYVFERYYATAPIKSK